MLSLKKLNRVQQFFFRYFPDLMTYPLIRKDIDINPVIKDSISIKVAETQDELEQAFKLVQESYEECELADIKESHIGVNKYHLLPTSATIILKQNEEVIAALSVITSNRYKLPLESVWNIDHLKSTGKTGEISSLAVSKNYSRIAKTHTLPMIQFLKEYSYKYLGIRFFVISINPVVAVFYRALFNFKYLDKTLRKDKFTNNASVQCLWLDLNFYKPQYKKNSNFFKKIEEQLKDFSKSYIFPQSKYYCALGRVLSPSLLEYFFEQQTSSHTKMSTEDVYFIREAYHFEHYRNLKLTNTIKKYFIFCNADLIIGEKVTQLETNAVSRSMIFGKIYNQTISTENDECILKLNISRNESLIIKGRVQIDTEFIQVIIEPNIEWDNFISYIEEKYYFKTIKEAA